MKVNDWALINISSLDANIEGRLHHKKLGGNMTQVFKERWFKLRNNILYYFNLNEMGQVQDGKPAGALILENCTASYEMISDAAFAFSLMFHDDIDRKHVFSGRTEENVNQWVKALKQASYEFWRSQLLILQMQLSLRTGEDPLLMYHRNEGSRLPLPAKDMTKLDSPSKIKLPKKTSFKSFVGSARPGEITAATAMLNGLNFDENHFGNGLDSIGAPMWRSNAPQAESKPSKLSGAITNVDKSGKVAAVSSSGTGLDSAQLKLGSSAIEQSPFRSSESLVPSLGNLPLLTQGRDSGKPPSKPALVPTRVAPPPPPTRPPRSSRQTTQQPTNLIDL